VSPVRARQLIAVVSALGLLVVPGVLLARAGTLADVPPPTPVPPDGHLSPFPTVLQTPARADAEPAIGAPAGILADLDTGAILWTKHADVARPIASLTKIMTAMLVLEHTDPDDVVTVAPEAVFAPDEFGAGSTAGLRAGERLRVDDLLYALVLGSANDAAEALAIHVSGSIPAFVQAMNARAAELGMHATRFASPHGLDDDGVSTARDVLRLALAARTEPRLRAIVATRFHRMPAPRGPDRRIQNRNALLWLYPGATGMKTGTTAGAGACVVATADRDGEHLIAVVLGAGSEPFSDAATLLDHGFAVFSRQVLVRAGEDLGALTLDRRSVPVTAGADVVSLVPAGVTPERTIAADDAAAFPPVPGSPVGVLTIRVDGRVAGSTSVIAGVPAAPRPVEGAWWARALGAVGRAAGEVIAGLGA
jgi:D-alanyl-D-alanine carboxypeptidase